MPLLFFQTKWNEHQSMVLESASPRYPLSCAPLPLLTEPDPSCQPEYLYVLSPLFKFPGVTLALFHLCLERIVRTGPALSQPDDDRHGDILASSWREYERLNNGWRASPLLTEGGLPPSPDWPMRSFCPVPLEPLHGQDTSHDAIHDTRKLTELLQ